MPVADHLCVCVCRRFSLLGSITSVYCISVVHSIIKQLENLGRKHGMLPDQPDKKEEPDNSDKAEYNRNSSKSRFLGGKKVACLS